MRISPASLIICRGFVSRSDSFCVGEGDKCFVTDCDHFSSAFSLVG